MIENTILVACNDIAIQQTKSTMKALNLCTWLLDYMATYPDPSIICYKLDMQLYISSDASYLSVSKSRSRVGGYHFLGNKPKTTIPLSEQDIFINAPIYLEVSILKPVVSAASESEIAAAHVNSKEGIPERICILEMNHPQPSTPLELDNTTAHGILTKMLISRRSKSIDMRLFWLRDRDNQNQFNIHWNRGTRNTVNYYTKHFLASYHQQMRKLMMLSCLISTITNDLNFLSLKGHSFKD